MQIDQSIYLSTTYLRLLRSDAELSQVLESALGDEPNTILDEEYIYGNTILCLFQTFADSGLDSWLLRFGQHLSVASHGSLGFTVLSAPDLRTAIDVLAEFTPIRTSAYCSYSAIDGNRISFVTQDQTKHPLIAQWMMESSLRVAQELVEAVMAHPLGDIATISFTHSRPSYHKELEAFFGIPIEYNSEVNSLSIPASWCRVSSPLSDPDTFRANLQKCRELKLKLSRENDVVEATKLDLNNFFEARIRGQARASDMPCLEQLAVKHHCSTRTFARRLGEHNQSYKLLLETCRREYAIDLLTHTHASIADISLQLNYQEPANFVRAFKTWFDMPPATWRRQQSLTMHPKPTKSTQQTNKL